MSYVDQISFVRHIRGEDSLFLKLLFCLLILSLYSHVYLISNIVIPMGLLSLQQDTESFGNTHESTIAGSYGRTLSIFFFFLRNVHSYFLSGCICLYLCPCYVREGSLSPYPCQHVLPFDYRHSDWHAVESYFQLYFFDVQGC